MFKSLIKSRIFLVDHFARIRGVEQFFCKYSESKADLPEVCKKRCMHMQIGNRIEQNIYTTDKHKIINVKTRCSHDNFFCFSAKIIVEMKKRTTYMTKLGFYFILLPNPGTIQYNAVKYDKVIAVNIVKIHFKTFVDQFKKRLSGFHG